MTEAAMVEPLSTATHAVRVAGDLEGKTVAVLGAGTIGLLTLLTARASGAVAAAVTDPIDAKRALALELGADLAVDPTQDGAVERIRDGLPWRPDVVFDCVSSQASTDQAIALALKGGTVVVEGVPRGDVRVPLPLIQDRELRLQGTAMYTREDVERAVGLIEGGVVPAARLVTAEFPLEQAAERFRRRRTVPRSRSTCACRGGHQAPSPAVGSGGRQRIASTPSVAISPAPKGMSTVLPLRTASFAERPFAAR